jgi:rare lipoprotein A
MIVFGCSSMALAESGVASVYAYSGQRTANGERARSDGLTAAHRTLPLARACVSRTKATAVVRINDRGRLCAAE